MREPSARAVDGGREQDRDEGQAHDAEARPDEHRLAVVAVVDPHDHAEQGDTEDRPHQLFDQEEVGLTVPFVGHHRRRAVDHDNAHGDQQNRGQEQDSVGLEFSSHSGL